jgi:hypothetical protein
MDSRLALGAAAAWLAVLGCAGSSARVSATVGFACSVLAVLVLVLGRRTRVAAALALGLFCVTLALLPLAARVTAADGSPLHVLARAGAPVTLDAEVATDPRTLAAK